MTADKTAIRDASTVIVIRHMPDGPRVLMGQRGANAAFMPSKFVFPGGATDEADATVPLAAPLGEACRSRLAEESTPGLDHALAVAAIRELWEETGQILGRPGSWPGPVPPGWAGFAATGHVPDASALRFVFRAITPPGRPRRFDARFFLLDAQHLVTDPDDFSQAQDELSHLQWIPLGEVRRFDLPFITEVVLAEITAIITENRPIESVPFFRNDDEASLFLRLRGRDMPQDG